MSTIEQGSVVGEYRVESLLRTTGSGGALYRAAQPNLRRTVVLLMPGAPKGSHSGSRFLEQARILAALEHPNLLPVYEVGETDERPYAAIRDASGRRLDELLLEGPLAPARALAIGQQVAAALDALVGAGAAPPRLPAASVLVAAENGRDHVYLSPLEAVADQHDTPVPGGGEREDSDISIALVAHLFTSMLATPRGDAATPEGLREPLRPLIEAALSGDQRYPSASSFAEAAGRAIAPPRPAARSRFDLRWVLSGVALIAVAVAVAAFFVAREDSPGTSGGSSAEPLVGRLEATIPLGARPGSVAIGEDAVWVATSEGTVLRIDPQKNKVVGAPIRFMEPREDENVTVRVGEGAVWVLDGTGGMLTRIDPDSARVTGRLRIGGILHGAAVGEGSIWISRAQPEEGFRQTGQLVRVDARTFERIGSPISIGAAAFDVEVGDGVVWTMNAGDGTVTRVDIATGATKTVRPSSQSVNAVLRDGTLWLPDAIDGTVTPLDARALVLPQGVVRAGYPISATSMADAVWVAARTLPDPAAPMRLYRLDAESRTLAGRPLELGANVGWISAGLGAVWVPNAGGRALLKIVPTSPPPAPRGTEEPQVRDPRPLLPGPLAAGGWQADTFAVPFGFSLQGRGWIGYASSRHVDLARFDEPSTLVHVLAPRQFFTSTGGVRTLASADRAAKLLSDNQNVVIVKRERLRVGGVPALRLTVRVRPHEGYPDFCSAPCVPLFPLPETTYTLDSGVDQRVSILTVDGMVVVAFETERPGGNRFETTGSVLRTLRFDAARR